MGIRKMTFKNIVKAIRRVHNELSTQAARAVNISLTIRNWLIGMHISEYELRGEDRSQYGDQIISELAAALTQQGISNSNRRELYRYLDFYRAYPGIIEALEPTLQKLLPTKASLKKVGTVSPQLQIAAEKLLYRLSYSHFELLVELGEAEKRTFYEIECIRGNWSVRELKRQISSLYFERSGLSKNKKKLAEIAQLQKVREKLRSVSLTEV